MDTVDTIGTTQYLTFRLTDETFALDIAKVREVLDMGAVTKVPRTPDYLRGVINLRGSVVPVVDLRLKLGMPMTERTVNTCIIITEVMVDGDTTVLGTLADSVQEVLDLDHGSITPAPRIGTKLRTEYLRGMGRRDERFIMILDIDRIFSVDGSALAQAAEQLASDGPTSIAIN